jgi:hypothetical protein
MQKTTSSAKTSSGLHSLPERGQIKCEKKKPVPVADFRRGYDQLWRIANVDYCACVGLDERKNWLSIAERILPDVAAMQSRRASAYDLEQHRSSIERIAERMESVRVQIVIEEAARNPKH